MIGQNSLGQSFVAAPDRKDAKSALIIIIIMAPAGRHASRPIRIQNVAQTGSRPPVPENLH